MIPIAYFPPYLDATGLRLPTYEDRLQDLLSSYRAIFGADADLTEASPDYQLLSLFAKSLDDLSGVLADVFASRDPGFATGAALDLLAPVCGVSRAEGESDPDLRNRMLAAASASATGPVEALDAALGALRYLKYHNIHVNDTSVTDAHSVPPHSLCVMALGGYSDEIARAIFDKKPPGIGTYGTESQTVTDAAGNAHTVSFSRATQRPLSVEVFLRPLEGYDGAAVPARIKSAVSAYADTLKIGQDLVVPALYGVCYAVETNPAPSFAILRIEAGDSAGTETELVEMPWDRRAVIPAASVTVTVSG